jgi:serine/threonine protein kinase
MKSLDHPNIARFIGYETDDKNLYIIMEYYAGANFQL